MLNKAGSALTGLAMAFGAVAHAPQPLGAETVLRPETRLVFLGADPAEGRPQAMASGLGILALPRLPEPGAAETEVLAALLRASPVSTFVSTPDAPTAARSGDLYLVVDVGLVPAEAAGGGVVAETPALSLGEQTMAPDAFAERLAALVDAFNPEARQILYLRIEDPTEGFASALPALSAATAPTGFGMSVLMVGPQDEDCSGQRSALHYPVLGGIADTDPSGNSDGKTTVAEATRWLTGALERDLERGNPCAARYSLILKADEDPRRTVVSSREAPLFPEMEAAVFRERFEALFLMSFEDEAPIRAYLDSCTYCPAEDALSDRLRLIADRRLALDLEAGIWEKIRSDADGERISVYLENCRLCAYREEAEATLARFEELEAARESEVVRRLSEARDLPGLREWISTCVVCEDLEEASATLAALEADDPVEAEGARLEEALALRSAEAVRAWLEGCELCAQTGEAEAALVSLDAEDRATEACLALAGLPQQGGPRLLSGIDLAAARALCGEALGFSPANALVATVLGRVEQAAGNTAEARAAFEAGLAAGIPAAYGLAAHMLLAPGQDEVADYQAAERLALEGHARGDWLSGEVLTVLYSRELVPGKGAGDAFEIARGLAVAGNPVAQFFTGYFHRIGAGTSQNDALAEEWLTKSVTQGYLHANSFLAELYEEGAEGLEADTDRAINLYWEALAGGDPTALDRLADQINDRSAPIVLGLQARLREVGFYDGPIDGIGGDNTVTAIRLFAGSVTGIQDSGAE